MRLKKRIFAVALSVVNVVFGCYAGFYAYAENETINLNKELLEIVINERPWIIDTLVYNDRTNNPYNAVVTFNGQSMKDEVLENYKANDAYQMLIDAMALYADTGEYISGFTDDVISVFMSWFGDDTPEGALKVADDLVKSTSELKYESILNDVLVADYKASWGETLQDSNMNLEYLRQQNELLKKLSIYQTRLMNATGAGFVGESEILVFDSAKSVTADYKITLEDYVTHFLDSYETDLKKSVRKTLDIPGVKDGSELERKINTAIALGAIGIYENVIFPDSMAPFTDEIYSECFFPGIVEIMKDNGKVIDLGEKTTKFAMLMEALRCQKESTVATMESLANITDDEKLVKVLKNYSEIVEAEGNNKILAYEAISNYISSEQKVSNIVKTGIEKTAAKSLEMILNTIDKSKDKVLSSSIADGIATAGRVASLSVWAADEAVNIKDTSKKTVVLKYLNRLISQAVTLFRYDYNTYSDNKTEENAKKVLNDLEFLKQLRLYGEKTAYNCIKNQMESWVGLLLGGGDTLELWQKRYQNSIDTYIGCTASPVSYNKLVLAEKETLVIEKKPYPGDSDYAGSYYTCATIYKADGTSYSFAEPEYRCFTGIDLNGATLKILGTESGIYLPVIDNDADGARVEVYCDNVAFGTVTNTAKMTLYHKNEKSKYEITNRIINTGTLDITAESNNINIKVYEYTNSGTVNIQGTQLDLISTGTNNGAINGKVNACGGKAYYQNAYYKMGAQAMMGKGTYSDLDFTTTDKPGVTVGEKITVTNSIHNENARLYKSKNITVINNCDVANGYFKGDLSFKDYESSGDITLSGCGYIYNNVVFNGKATFGDLLSLTSDCKNLTLNSGAFVDGDISYAAGTITGAGTISVKGDVSISASSPSISALCFAGNTAQRLSSSNSVNIGVLKINNSSSAGIDFSQKVYVKEKLIQVGGTKHTGGKNLVLTGTATVESQQLKGDLSIENWTCTKNLNVKGALYSSGSNSIADDVTLATINYYQTDGSVTVNKNSRLTCSGEFSNKGTITNNGTITVTDDSLISGAVSGGTFRTKGSINSTADFAPTNLIFESKVAQSFTSSGTTTVENLTVSNTSASGFTVNSIINVTKSFNDNSKKIVNGNKIVLSDGAVYLLNGKTKTDLTLTGEFVVKEGETLTINGNLELGKNAKLIVENGAEVLVKRALKTTSAQINVSEGGKIQVDDYLMSNSDTLNIGGDLTVKGDSKITSSVINAGGLITFKGDLNSSNCTWNNPNIAFDSKLPQTVGGSAINADKLIVNNQCRLGITFNCKVNYYGDLFSEGSVINGQSNLVQQNKEA